MKTKRKYSILIFLLSIFGVSWIGIYSIIGLDSILGKKEIDMRLMPMLMIAMVGGPFVATAISVVWDGGLSGIKQFLKKTFQRPSIKLKSLRYLLYAPIVTFVTTVMLSIFSKRFTPSVFQTDEWFGIIIGGIIGGFIAGFFEEIAWSGFLLPKLRERYSPIVSGLLIGGLWGLWHLPLFTLPDPQGVVPQVLLIAIKLWSVLPVFRIAMVCVYERTNNLWSMILMHMTLTASTLIFQSQASTGVEMVLYNFVWVVIGGLSLFVFKMKKSNEI